MDPPLPLQTKLAKGEAPGTFVMCGPGQQPGCVHYGTSSLGFVLAAAAVFSLAMVCTVLLLLMRLRAQGFATAVAQEGSNPQPEDKTEAMSAEVALQVRGATLVLFPGEEKPRTLAVPSQLHSNILPQLQPHHHPHIVLSVSQSDQSPVQAPPS